MGYLALLMIVRPGQAQVIVQVENTRRIGEPHEHTGCLRSLVSRILPHDGQRWS